MITSLRPDPRHAWDGDLAASATSELEIRRSRFISHLARCADEGQARGFVEAVRERYPDARHHCSAYVVAVAGAHDVEHSSDDGEPAGTAGRPMLDVLKAADLGCVCVVVVRYFGGVLLGTGGLVRAYTDATREVLTGLPVVRSRARQLLEVEAEHGDAGVLEHGLQQLGLAPLTREYTGRLTRFTVAAADADELGARMSELSAGRAAVHLLGPIEVEEPAGTL
ncbi:IMPACT family protein [Propionibacteriaceae bacterium Y1923]